MFSVAWGFSGAFALPLLLTGLLRSPSRVGQGFLGKLKKVVPAFNYVNAVYMSKWVILWHNLFNFATPSLLSARDEHELREKATKVLAYDLFYFVGDDILNGMAGKYFQNRHAKQLGGISLMKTHALGALKIPTGRRLNTIYELVNGNTRHPAYQYSLKSFLFSFIGTTVCLGIATNLVNNWYTRKKVRQEQQQMQQHKTSKQLLQRHTPAGTPGWIQPKTPFLFPALAQPMPSYSLPGIIPAQYSYPAPKAFGWQF